MDPTKKCFMNHPVNNSRDSSGMAGNLYKESPTYAIFTRTDFLYPVDVT